jgi:hypothetical protein
MGEHEKGDLDEGHVIHQKWSGVRYKVWGVYFNYEEKLLGEIIILKINEKYYENQREKLIRIILIST